MPAIFPGIDPFLEAQGYWPDFHARFIIYCSDAIADLLPDSYLTRIEERIHLVERVPEGLKRIRPDLTIERQATPTHAAAPAPAPGVALALEAEPTAVPLPMLEEVRQTAIQILHRPDRTLVTVVELLSPDNKAEPGWGQYLGKRRALLGRPVHLVELDFLVGGHRLPMGRPLPAGDAFAIVSRWDRRPEAEVYAWSIRRALSPIRVPLLAPDPDLVLDLAAVYATAMARGRYGRSIDYAAPLALGLADDDRAWAEQRADPS